jgi:hypothetical protein
MGKNIKFKSAFVKQLVDDSGRAMTFRGSINPDKAKYKEELQIQVQNGNNIVMWNQE